MPKFCILFLTVLLAVNSKAQLKWINVDSNYALYQKSLHLFKCTDSIEGLPSIAFYLVADIKDKTLSFFTDTTLRRRITPSAYYERNDHPEVVVNGTFFNLTTSQNLDVVVKEGKMVAFNVNRQALKGKDTLLYRYTTRAAIGINKKRQADAAWIYSDSSFKFPIAYQLSPPSWKGNVNEYSKSEFDAHSKGRGQKWKMQTVIGGGPMLVQNGVPHITNDEEQMFAGKAINDRHPRTAMGYTADHKLIILVVEGRNKGVAEGASLVHLANILVSLGCVEALNLDGGGSSCLLINGRETIKPSDKEGQRAIPAVLLVSSH